MIDIRPSETKIAIFRQKEIRRVIYNNEWWFSVVDVMQVLTDSVNPQVYWRVLKKRLIEQGSYQTVTNCNGLKMQAPDGKMRETECANTESIFRLIQLFLPQKPSLSNSGWRRSAMSEFKKLKTQN